MPHAFKTGVPVGAAKKAVVAAARFEIGGCFASRIEGIETGQNNLKIT